MICWLWNLGLGSLFCKNVLKKKRIILWVFPLDWFVPSLDPIPCVLFLFVIFVVFGNYLMKIMKEIIKD